MHEHAFRKEECEEAVDRECSAAAWPIEVVSNQVGPFTQTKPPSQSDRQPRAQPLPQAQPQPRRYAISLFWNVGLKITRPKRQAVAPKKKAQAEVEPTPWNQDCQA